MLMEPVEPLPATKEDPVMGDHHEGGESKHGPGEKGNHSEGRSTKEDWVLGGPL